MKALKIFALVLVSITAAVALLGAGAGSQQAMSSTNLGTSIPTISPWIYFGGGTSGVRPASSATHVLVGGTSTSTNAFVETPTIAITSLASQSCIGTAADGTVQAGTCGSLSALGTTTPWTVGQIVQVVNGGTVKSVATSSIGLPTFSDLAAYTPNTRTISTTYPIQGGGDLSANRTFSLAFGTTTSNTWAGTQTFTNTISGSITGNAGTVTNGIYTTDTGTVTNTMLAGSIANAKLSNSSVTINGSSVSLGSSVTVSAASSTLLANSNTWSGLNSFVNATTSLLSSGALWLTSITGSTQCLHVDSTGRISGTGSECGSGSGSGTVTSVAASVPTGLAISGSPITTSGTLALSWDTGYAAMKTASSTNWTTAYDSWNTNNANWTTAYTSRITSVNNDTNVTGSIAGNALTLGWTGTLADARIASAATWNAKESALTFTYPLSRSSNTISWSGLATTSQPSSSNLLVSNGGAGVYGAATSSLTLGSDFTTTGTAGYVVGGSSWAINCRVASGSQSGCLSSADWTTFNNKGSGTVTSIATMYPITGGIIATTGTIGLAFGTSTANSWSQLQVFSSGIISYASSTIGDGTRTGGITIFGSSTTTGSAYFADKVGIGTTSPSSYFSIAASNLTSAIMSIVRAATGLPLFYMFVSDAVSASSIVSDVWGAVDTGVRVLIGSTHQYGHDGGLDQLYVSGRISTGEWRYVPCDFVTYVSHSSDTQNALCNGWAFGEDGTMTTQDDIWNGDTYKSISIGAGTVSGGGYFFGGSPWLQIGYNTPVLEGAVRIATPSQASTTSYYFGFVNVAFTSSTMENYPTNGCFFNASSSAATGNWYAVALKSTGSSTFVDTGIASSTSLLSSGYFYRLRIDTSEDRCDFYIQPYDAPISLVATIDASTNSLATTTTLTPAIFLANQVGGSGFKWFDFKYLRIWFRSSLY